ncbi:MAG: hypothetical protein ACJ8FY_07065 [Gemmataceae bacterium]
MEAVAALSRRLSRAGFDRGGVAAISRWLSAATPPEKHPVIATIPEGVAEGPPPKPPFINTGKPVSAIPYKVGCERGFGY